MLNRSASLAMSTSVLKALPGKGGVAVYKERKKEKDAHLVFSIYFTIMSIDHSNVFEHLLTPVTMYIPLNHLLMSLL